MRIKKIHSKRRLSDRDRDILRHRLTGSRYATSLGFVLIGSTISNGEGRRQRITEIKRIILLT